MARPQKKTVDYFPHDAVPGKTLFILQSRFGNNGYAAWFKILALLCRTPGHFYDCNKPADWQFLVAETALSVPETQLVMDCLAELDAIDRELWSHRIIWSQNLVTRIADAYKDRKASLPVKPPINGIKPPDNSNKPPDNPQTKRKEIKLKEIKGNTTTPTPPPENKLSLSLPEEVKEKNVYELYMEEIEPVKSDLMRNTLTDAVDTYTEDWVRDAIKEAVRQKVRKWSYIEKILKNWVREGRDVDGAEPQEKVYRTSHNEHTLRALERVKDAPGIPD